MGWLVTERWLLITPQLIKVDITVQGNESKVVERPWHRGDMPLEHVLNINKRPPMVLPP
jgi:hypothetical protein